MKFDLFTIPRPIASGNSNQEREDVLFAQCVWGEARGESDEGIRAVAVCITNRWLRKEPYWGENIREIILKSNSKGVYQFTCMNPKNPNYAKLVTPDHRSWERVYSLVLPIYLQPPSIHHDSWYFYYNPTLVKNNPFSKYRKLTSIGNHDFYTDVS